MLPRQRVQAALEFRSPDVLPLRIFPAAGGLYEPGQKLVDLIAACGHDFGPLDSLRVPAPPPKEHFDPDGRYHAITTDDWGTTWEFRFFGIWGHPLAWPIGEESDLDSYRAPAVVPLAGEKLAAAQQAGRELRKRYYHLAYGGGIFEKMFSLRRFEDVLIDLAEDNALVARMADMIAEHVAAQVGNALAADCDAVAFGDDFGTTEALMMSPAMWRRFFGTRYKTLCDPVLRAGKRVFLHSCGQLSAILPDLGELGITVLWPQLTLFDRAELRRRCRDLGICLELHPDRGELMQRGTPEQVREYILRLADDFDCAHGGAWLYLEVDPGFPWPNVEAMFETAMRLRGM